jgi:hypothetical protein
LTTLSKKEKKMKIEEKMGILNWKFPQKHQGSILSVFQKKC